MNSLKMKKELEARLSNPNRNISYNREKDVLRIENKRNGKGITISLPGIVAKWHVDKEKAIDEMVYYIEEGLRAMEDSLDLASFEKNIYPVIRSASFPTKTKEDISLFFEEHTAETRIYYVIDMGKTYRLIDFKMMEQGNWTESRIKEIALFNLKSLPTDLKEDHVSGNVFYFVNSNDGYDASRILNKGFLNEMHKRISGTMVIAVPHQDVLIIGDIQNDVGYDVLAQMTMAFFTNGRVPITALSFFYEDGNLEPIFILGKNLPSK